MSDAAINMLLTQEAQRQNEKQDRYNTVWNDYMSQLSGAGDLLNANENSIATAFNKYMTGLKGNTDTYTSGLSSLADSLKAPENQITFGMEGMDPVSFTNKSARENASTLSDLLGKTYSANNTPLTETWSYEQNHTPQTAALNKLNMYGNLASQIKGGDYSAVLNGIGTTAATSASPTTMQKITSGLNILQGMGNLIGGTSDTGGNGLMSIIPQLTKMFGAGASASATAAPATTAAGASSIPEILQLLGPMMALA